jgi:hypothetical protein
MATVRPSDGPGVSDSELEELLRFLEQLRKLMEWAVEGPESAVPAYLKTPLRDAWAVSGGRFESLRTAIADRKLDSELVTHGLTGPELAFKLLSFRAYYFAWDRLRQARRQSGGGFLGMLRRIIARRPEPTDAEPASTPRM